MSNFIHRLNEEKIDLHDRMVKLQNFLREGDVSKVNKRELDLLSEQLQHMQSYYAVLNQRCYFHGVGEWPLEADGK